MLRGSENAVPVLPFQASVRPAFAMFVRTLGSSLTMIIVVPVRAPSSVTVQFVAVVHTVGFAGSGICSGGSSVVAHRLIVARMNISAITAKRPRSQLGVPSPSRKIGPDEDEEVSGVRKVRRGEMPLPRLEVVYSAASSFISWARR